MDSINRAVKIQGEEKPNVRDLFYTPEVWKYFHGEYGKIVST